MNQSVAPLTLAARPRVPALSVLALAVSAALAGLTPAVQAQETSPSLGNVIVTATRTAEESRDVLADHTVITSEDIARSGQTSLLDLLGQQHGVEITTSGGPASLSSVFLRGTANAQNVVLVDGVRVGSSITGGATWSSIPLPEIDHIDIVYGPLTTLYGADAIGGVIQIFTKKGDGAPRLTAGAGIGTYNTQSLDASISGAVKGDHTFRYALSAARESSDGFNATRPQTFNFNPDADGYQRNSATGQFSLDLAKGHEIGLVFLQSHTTAQFDAGLDPADSRSQQKLENVAVYSRNRLTDNWTSQLQLSQSRDAMTANYTDTPSTTTAVQKDLTWQNDIRLGSDRVQVLAERRLEEATSFDQYAGSYSPSRNTNSLAASYSLRRGRHLADVSVRRDDNSQFGGATTGSVGYGYRLTDTLRASASFGTSFRAPTFLDLYYPGYSNPNLRPEKGHNVEAGLYYEDGKTQASAVVYQNRITDLIQAPPPDYLPENVAKAKITGLTVSARHDYGNWNVRAALDLQDPRDETADTLLRRRAREHATLAAERVSGALRSGIEWVLSGKRNETATTTLGGYGLVNLYANYAFNRDWTLLARWNNVTNKDYELAQNYNTPGSNVFIGVRYAMK